MQVLLPLKEFATAKQRLSGVLSAAERAQFFQAMVEDVLRVLTRHSGIAKIIICSRDQAARWLASYYGVDFIDESRLRAQDLNAAVNAAVREIYARGESDVLVVHGDLPLLNASDVSVFLDAHRKGSLPAITIASDRHGNGTNLLAWRDLPNFFTEYGEHSFQRHCAQARALKIEPSIYDLPSARCDIDEPADLLFLLAHTLPAGAAKTLTFLHESGIARRLLAMQCGTDIFCDGDGREHA